MNTIWSRAGDDTFFSTTIGRDYGELGQKLCRDDSTIRDAQGMIWFADAAHSSTSAGGRLGRGSTSASAAVAFSVVVAEDCSSIASNLRSSRRRISFRSR